MVSLDSGLFAHERLARGMKPERTLKITGRTTRSEIARFLKYARPAPEAQSQEGRDDEQP
jgi:hypothetical protein